MARSRLLPALGPLWWLVLPVLCVGLFCRVYYTPDEPREATLTVAMASQSQQAVPELGGEYFMEKPPLLYWLGAASVGVFGNEPWAVRLPGLAYGVLVVGALSLLARRAGGPLAGFVAGTVAATSLLCYQVEVWLATDAPLLAGVAVALAGLYAGYTATTRRTRLWGYGAFHLGLLLAFFSKNVAGWMVPVLAFATLLVSERRLREIVRTELWLPLPLLLAPIIGWVCWVARLPEGAVALKVLFWNNLVGRAVDVGNSGPYVYTTGHLNSPGKYLLELPLYLLPWTPLAVAALVRAWHCRRLPGDVGTAWRLGLATVVPATLLLSFAATARGVYYAPAALGFALLIGLWAADQPAGIVAATRRWIRATAIVLAVMALLVGALAALAAFAPRDQRGAAVVLGLCAISGTLGTLVCVRRVFAAVATERALWHLGLGAACLLCLCAGSLYLRLNPWLDLAVAARRLQAAAAAPLQVLDPDETTQALAELYLPAARTVEPGTTALRRDAWVVYQDPDRRQWKLREWLAWLGYRAPAHASAAVTPVSPLLAQWLAQCAIDRPGGRTYWLYSPPGVTMQAKTCSSAGGRVP